jgi:hypothetical protein
MNSKFTPSTAFKKGDPRAVAAGRKSKRVKLPRVQVSFMDEIRKMEPELLVAMKKGLAKGDTTVMRMIVDRLAPLQLATDHEVKETIKALTDKIEAMTKELEDAGANQMASKAEAAFAAVDAMQPDKVQTSRKPSH